jgi:sulfate transport system permease protein
VAKAPALSGTRHFTAGKWILIAAVWIYIIILIIAPVGALIVGTFKQGMQPVVEALTSPDFLSSFKLTIQISVIVALVQLVLGTLLAWVLVRQSFRGKSILNGMIDLPFAVSPVVVGYMLLLLFGRNSFLGPLLSTLGIKVAFAVPGMVLATLFVTLPMVVREMLPVIRRLDRTQELAAETLGASGWKTFWSVVFPALKTALIYGTTLTLARALGEFGAILVIGGGIQGRTETTTLYIFRALEERHYTAAYAAALVIGLCTVTLVTVADWLRRRGGGE